MKYTKSVIIKPRNDKLRQFMKFPEPTKTKHEISEIQNLCKQVDHAEIATGKWLSCLYPIPNTKFTLVDNKSDGLLIHNSNLTIEKFIPDCDGIRSAYCHNPNLILISDQ